MSLTHSTVQALTVVIMYKSQVLHFPEQSPLLAAHPFSF